MARFFRRKKEAEAVEAPEADAPEAVEAQSNQAWDDLEAMVKEHVPAELLAAFGAEEE